MTAEKINRETAGENGAEAVNDDRPRAGNAGHIRMVEALLFAATEPLDEGGIAVRLPDGVKVPEVLEALRSSYQSRGINLVKVGGKWAFHTAPDLAHLLRREVQAPRRLSRAAVETLAIVAYHQPTTRAEIEEIRGVSISRGTLDLLMETGWVRIAGRRRTPGRPVTYAITDDFLEHFGLEDVKDLPGVRELKAAGLLDSSPPLDFLNDLAETLAEEETEDTDEDTAENDGIGFGPDPDGPDTAGENGDIPGCPPNTGDDDGQTGT